MRRSSALALSRALMGLDQPAAPPQLQSTAEVMNRANAAPNGGAEAPSPSAVASTKVPPPTTTPPWSSDIAAAVLSGQFGDVVLLLADSDGVSLSSSTPIAAALLCAAASSVPRLFIFALDGSNQEHGGLCPYRFIWALLQSPHVGVTVFSGAPVYNLIIGRFGTTARVAASEQGDGAVLCALHPERVLDLTVLHAAVRLLPIDSTMAISGLPSEAIEQLAAAVATVSEHPYSPWERRLARSSATLFHAADILEAEARSAGTSLAVRLDTEMTYIAAALTHHGLAAADSAVDAVVADASHKIGALKGVLLQHLTDALLACRSVSSDAGPSPAAADCAERLIRGSVAERCHVLRQDLGLTAPDDADFFAHVLATTSVGKALAAVLEASKRLTQLQHTLRPLGEADRSRAQTHESSMYLIHPLYDGFLVSRTGRIFSSRPNIQTLPVAARGAIVAPPGTTLVSVDYSQVELRVLAALCGDPNLLAALRSSDDVLCSVARMMLGGGTATSVTEEERQAAKAVVYGIVYGMGNAALQERLDKAAARRTADSGPRAVAALDAAALREAFSRAFPGVEKWIDGVYRDVLATRRVQSTLTGRVRRFELQSTQRGTDAATLGRQAVGFCVQGGAADLLKAALGAVWPRTSEHASRYAVLAPIHDEILFAVDDASMGTVLPHLVQCMSITAPEQVALHAVTPLPVSVKSGKTWGTLTRCDVPLPVAATGASQQL